ncbi:MAG TPA: hypothetical protein PKD79_03295 [Candidatus Doudnabacteria bacterium]|nr:hypothetical protein [Candidatus Doudnabacteria bacterium]
MTTKQTYLFIGILALAVFFRLFLIGQLPGGLFPDEAANGLDINSMQQGDLQPFYERGNGREALFFYMLWGSVEIFGKTPFAHHLVSGIVGILTVIITFFVTRRLVLLADENGNKDRATWIALLAMFFVAVSTWHIVLSRTAFRANLIPLFASLTFYFIVAAVQVKTRAKQYWMAALAGTAFALGFYTYIAYRILAPVFAIIVFWPMLVDIFKQPRFLQIKKYFAPTLLAGLAFTIFIFPLAHYFYTHPGSFVGRSGQVSIFNPELNQGDLPGTFLHVTGLSLKAYFWDGDLNWRHNISGEPFLSIIISPFLLLGMILTIWFALRYTFLPHKYPRDWVYFALAGWFWSMLLPVVTTAEGIPHGLRAIGTIPVVFIITAIGLYRVVEWAHLITNKYWEGLSHWKQQFIIFLKTLLIASFVAALTSQAYILYFIKAANSPEYAYAFRSDLTVVAEYLNQEGEKTNTYVVVDKFSVQTLDYMTFVDGRNPNNPRNNPYTQIDPEDSWQLTNLQSGDKIVFTQSSLFDIKKFKEYHPNTYRERQVLNHFGQTVLAVYVVN